jgi:hypothetical protein
MMVASKLHEVLSALCSSAILRQLPILADDIRKAANELYKIGRTNGRDHSILMTGTGAQIAGINWQQRDIAAR